jgi:hypothetical protein
MTRQQSIERMSRLVAPRAIALLERVREACPEVSFTEPEDECGDDVRWGMWHERSEGEGVDAYVEAHLSDEHDGSRGGVNFGLHMTGWGGEIIAMVCPHNYTPDVWVRVRDLSAVDARLAELESVDLSGVQDMMLEHLSRRAA